MRRSLLLSTVALTGCFILGCGDPPRITGPGDSPAPSFGAQRFPVFTVFEMGGDPSTSLALLAGFEASVTADDVCAGTATVEESGQTGKVVLIPSGGALIQQSARDANIVVYQFGGGPVTGPCDLAGAPLVGTGTGNFQYSIQDPGPGAFGAHVTVQGIIDLVSGGEARVLGVARVTALPDGTLLFDHEVVTLTPL
jgi:hypothetical protein